MNSSATIVATTIRPTTPPTTPPAIAPVWLDEPLPPVGAGEEVSDGSAVDGSDVSDRKADVELVSERVLLDEERVRDDEEEEEVDDVELDEVNRSSVSVDDEDDVVDDEVDVSSSSSSSALVEVLVPGSAGHAKRTGRECTAPERVRVRIGQARARARARRAQRRQRAEPRRRGVAVLVRAGGHRRHVDRHWVAIVVRRNRRDAVLERIQLAPSVSGAAGPADTLRHRCRRRSGHAAHRINQRPKHRKTKLRRGRRGPRRSGKTRH